MIAMRLNRSGKKLLSAYLRQYIRFDNMHQYNRYLLSQQGYFEVQSVSEANGKVYVLIDKQYNNVPMDRTWIPSERVDAFGNVLNQKDLVLLTALQKCTEYNGCQECPLFQGPRSNCRVNEKALALIKRLRDTCYALQRKQEEYGAKE